MAFLMVLVYGTDSVYQQYSRSPTNENLFIVVVVALCYCVALGAGEICDSKGRVF